ncbi:hypothetical protein A2631_00065 [Candidatus Daviesbacteria bacterium RIFCSPHIGHO2_01_FULL_44_29]|uniref:PIN domain-containing protein n=1 Tax=Candidatus Daviesbacteria bacterium RIFCSPHIGHO2_02_FULL_43_12 TaxID=1797776 RepID=A0A1F5KIC5_9BACT|nr:MAG: hypothetical protein A2631_00065 [Candidatus Daviesbacteria bacterium RIFCSPHIGHO2_01_FULL_44_29]OGE40570.1 MAG: hypothetical protein A3D25_00430 [Candidatus Daviesbacteria bacterium RIFCSPHIGHO2_02_FULL_43_12]OGE40913.1 MAG: hypothetical protein A3E86_05485 [Candidatus Daviesbacteria bacterium RIFCSPHIGHO2_12_FULL_47_45]OGE70130.1 MAG: hypothetical protein A3B55_00200 [Candidatus Daviesbacteria bacterium RIFCSPLOWO2_01_FULL_43_15]
MIFIDTNYFLRFILKDNQQHSVQAANTFRQAALGELSLVTSTVVFFEIAWTLRHIYKNDHLALGEILFKLLQLNFEINDRGILIKAVIRFKDSDLELIDCYNLELAKDLKVKEFKTFDQKLARAFDKLA